MTASYSLFSMQVNNFWLDLAYSGSLAIAIDFGWFIVHFLAHKIPFLWEFHKVHHSAPVMSPITVRRFHPLESVLLTMGRGFGGLSVIWIFGLFSIELSTRSLIMYPMIVSSTMIVQPHRHSHIWISFGLKTSLIFSSPAMHQIHHSDQKEHLDKNFGFLFSFFDYLFGTIYIPRQYEKLSFGLANKKAENEMNSSLSSLYITPFKKAFLTLREK